MFYLLVLGRRPGRRRPGRDRRRGAPASSCIGGALLLAAAVRLVLADRDAGMLAVRHKSVDVALLVVLGVALIFLAGSIPNQPG